ncbi:MAG: Chaperone protein YajL [Verrucomicrobiota bacterium]|jgi:4-methyl-5(b-hydroxyethyl)-thiazole monophosphate biosynthesis
MKRVLCILETGFEEIETVTPVDLLRRAGIKVVMAGVSTLMVTGRSGISIQADALLEDTELADFDVLFLPGGPAVMELRKNDRVLEIIRKFHTENKPIAAICAAPLLLHDAGILKGKAFTSHVSTMTELPQSNGQAVVLSENLFTSRGAGTAMEFGLALIGALIDHATAAEVSKAIMA